jgi:hypothetical protein
VKANHVRSYISKLEKHKTEKKFPPEIEGRLCPPVLQFSKEYTSTSQGKIHKDALRIKTEKYKMECLDDALEMKKKELTHLHSLIQEDAYKDRMDTIEAAVLADLFADSSIEPMEDGTIDLKNLPEFIKLDYGKFHANKYRYAARALAIAYTTIQKEMNSQMKALRLKELSDKDTQMTDATSKQKTVAEIVKEELAKHLKETSLKINPSSGTATPRDSSDTCSSRNADLFSQKSRKRGSCPENTPQPQEKTFAPGCTTQKQGRRKRKREWEEEVSTEMKSLARALRGTTQWSGTPGQRSGNAQLGARSSLDRLRTDGGSVDRLPLTKTARHGVLANTTIAYSFLEKHSHLWNSVSEYTRNKFVLHHTPVSLFEFNHEFASGIFMGPDVEMPQDIEWDLARNIKFILHEPSNALRVYDAWNMLERSVRIRWHFRDSPSIRSKFYVPKKTWQPRADQRNKWIEKGLEKGKDLLIRQADSAALHLGQTRKSNPDLRKIHSFLRQSQFLVKITDKNLGVAVVTKNWYTSECSRLLSDKDTYAVIGDIVDDIREEVMENIRNLNEMFDIPKSTMDYLLSSKDDQGLPSFHGIPKVHKKDWVLRPIIPSHSWITRKSSEVADFLLRQCIKEVVPWCIESTRDLMQRLEEVNLRTDNNDIWIVTGDVQSFYTNVPINETIREIETQLGSRTFEGIPTDMLENLLRIVMLCNVFEFNGQIYHQKTGIAMGTSCAPAFANLSLGFKELASKMLHATDACLKFYARYIDDVFLIFRGPRTTVESWLEKFTPTLKPYSISWEIRSIREATPFLDAEFFFRQGLGLEGLLSRVFRKRMNKHQYIPWSSAHPETVKRAFVKAELTRFMIISSHEEFFEERVREFMEALGRRGYPSDTLRRWRKLVDFKERPHQLRKKKDVPAGLPLMLPSSYDELWEYVDVKSVLTTMRSEWIKAGSLPDSLEGPLIKSLRRTENLFDKISVWNKAVLKGRNLENTSDAKDA